MAVLSVSPDAEKDISEAAKWYEEQKSGLGQEFMLSLDAIMQSIIRNPLQFPVIYKEFRRALLYRFPFAVFYIIEGKTIIILAVLHQFRNPKVWKKRK